MNEKSWNDYTAGNYDDHQNEAETKSLGWRMSRNYLEPSFEEIGERKEINEFFKSGKMGVVIPMKEIGPVIRPLLSRITTQFPNKMVCVVNDRSDQAAISEAKSFGVSFVESNEILNFINWKKLLPVLNLSKIPHGKGVAVLAGYLFHYFLSELNRNLPDWICQHDAELSNVSRFHNIEYIAWALAQAGHEKPAHHVKIAKYGRGNERPMVARSCLVELQYLPDCIQNQPIKERAIDLFNKLAPLKWMLSGQFALSWESAMSRPFATGYLEETLTTAFIEDLGEATERYTLQVANPNPCVGGVNGHRKEGIILQIASNFVFTLSIFAKKLNEWTIGDIEKFNHEFMSTPRMMAMIPSNEGPVIGEIIPQERIIPSIEMLTKGGFIDRNIIEFVRKYI